MAGCREKGEETVKERLFGQLRVGGINVSTEENQLRGRLY